MPTVAVTVGSFTPSPEGPLSGLYGAGYTVRHHPHSPSTPTAQTIADLVGCEAVVASSETYDDAVFAALPRLRHVARFGVGYDAIDLAAATRHGVVVTTTPGANASAVADLAFGLILATARDIAGHDRAIRGGTWRSRSGADVYEATLGIIGLGRIGRGVAHRARGFDMRVIAHDPFPNTDYATANDIELLSIEAVMGEADFVTVHVPSSNETDGLIGADLLRLMKPTAFLINTARGRIVDEDALYVALRDRWIAGAGLDVRRVEPPVDERFNALTNVIMTPHTAASTVGAQMRSGEMVTAQIRAVLRGEAPEGLMNADVMAALRSRA
jgi:D-3-phosphoglycerate dehydrogenase